MLHGGLASVDPLHGLDNDFPVYSRLGVSAALAGLMRLGLPATLAFRLLMLASLGLLLGANAGLLAWRYRLNPLLACVPALLFPGLFESAWFFNGNVLSAGLSSAALLLFWSSAPGRGSLAASVGAAALWGLAVACRTDAVLLAPAFAVLGWFKLRDWRACVRHALVAGPVAVAVPVLVYAAFGLNILEVLPLTRQATAPWARTDTWAHVLQPFLKGLSAPGLLAVAAGAAAVPWRRRWPEALLCLLVPLLYVLAYGRMLTEVRYLLPLTPLFGILMVEGWRAVQAASRGAQPVAGVAFAVAPASCFAMPDLQGWRPTLFMSADHDTRRPFPGRFWSPLPAMWWNRTLDAGAAALSAELERRAATAGEAPGRPVLVVSTHWTPDRMVDLPLRERGLVLAQAALPAACARVTERFVRDGATVTHFRPHLPIAPAEQPRTNWELLAVPCLQALRVGGDAPMLAAGWAEAGRPASELEAVGVSAILTPLPSSIPSLRFVTGRRYGYVVAQARTDAVPLLLEGPVDGRGQDAACAALEDKREWAASRINASRVDASRISD